MLMYANVMYVCMRMYAMLHICTYFHSIVNQSFVNRNKQGIGRFVCT